MPWNRNSESDGDDLIERTRSRREASYAEGVAFRHELKLPREASAQFTEMLGPALPDRHNLALMPIPRPDAGYALAFLARLYGGPAEMFLLAEFEGPIPELRRPIVLLVDYVNHKIEQPVIEESVIASARKTGA